MPRRAAALVLLSLGLLVLLVGLPSLVHPTVAALPAQPTVSLENGSLYLPLILRRSAANAPPATPSPTTPPTATASPTATLPPTAMTPTATPPAPAPLGQSTWAFVPRMSGLPGSAVSSSTAITAQNVGSANTRIAILYFAENQGFCPPQAAQPFRLDCSGFLMPGASWSWLSSSATKSAVVFSFDPFPVSNPDYYQCANLDALRRTTPWPTGWPGVTSQFPFDWSPFHGEPIAVTVQHASPGNTDPSGVMVSAYTGVSAAQQTVYDPFQAGYVYHVPVAFSGYSGFNSWLAIQNSGSECTDVEVWFKAQDDCSHVQVCEVLQLAPGYTADFNVSACVAPGFVGTVDLRSSQPLSIVASHVGPNVERAETAAPQHHGQIVNGEWTAIHAPASGLYAPLVYSQPPWQTRVHVQNSSSLIAADVTLTLLNAAGESVGQMTQLLCPRGSTGFDIRNEAVKAVRVEGVAHEGEPAAPIPVNGSVEISLSPSPFIPRQTMSYELMAATPGYTWGQGADQAMGTALVSLPRVQKHSLEESLLTRVALQNTASGAGPMQVAVLAYNLGGLMGYECVSLTGNEVKYIDVNDRDWLPPDFRGSLVISATHWERPAGATAPTQVGLIATLSEQLQLADPSAPRDQAWAVAGVQLPPTPGLVAREGLSIVCPAPTPTPGD